MSQPDKFTKRVTRKYMIELGVAMVAYAIVLVVAIPLMTKNDDLLVRSLIVLTPMIPIAFATVAIYRQILRVDEFQRLQAFKVIVLAAAGTALLSMGYGFLELAGFPRLSMMVVWPVMGLIWGVLGVFLHFKNRIEL